MGITALLFKFGGINSLFSLLTLIPSGVIYLTPALTYLYNYGKARINRLIDFANRRKFAKEEIKSLTKGHPEIKLITDDKDKEEKYIMIEEKTEQKDDSFEISKLILQEIASITECLKSITNEEEKRRIGLKIQELLDEFNDRFSQIDQSSKDGKIILDGLQLLKFEMIPRIENIKREINLIISKQSITDERTRMSFEIQKSLNEIIGGRQLKKDNSNH